MSKPDDIKWDGYKDDINNNTQATIISFIEVFLIKKGSAEKLMKSKNWTEK